MKTHTLDLESSFDEVVVRMDGVVLARRSIIELFPGAPKQLSAIDLTRLCRLYGQVSASVAASRFGLSRRQVFRIWKTHRELNSVSR